MWAASLVHLQAGEQARLDAHRPWSHRPRPPVWRAAAALPRRALASASRAGARDELKAVIVIELLGNVLPEGVPARGNVCGPCAKRQALTSASPRHHRSQGETTVPRERTWAVRALLSSARGNPPRTSPAGFVPSEQRLGCRAAALPKRSGCA